MATPKTAIPLAEAAARAKEFTKGTEAFVGFGISPELKALEDLGLYKGKQTPVIDLYQVVRGALVEKTTGRRVSAIQRLRRLY